MPAPPDAAHGHASTRNTTLLLLLPLLALTALTVMSVAALQQPAHPHDAQQPHLLLLHGTLHHEQYIPYHSTSTHIQRRRRAHELQQQVPQIIGATQAGISVSQDTPPDVQKAVLAFADWVQRALAGSMLGLQTCHMHHMCLHAGHCLYWSMCTPRPGATPTISTLLALPAGAPALSFIPHVVGGPDPASLLARWQGGPGVVSVQGGAVAPASVLVPLDALVQTPAAPSSAPKWGGRRRLTHNPPQPTTSSSTTSRSNPTTSNATTTSSNTTTTSNTTTSPTNSSNTTDTHSKQGLLLDGPLALAIASMSDIRALHISGVQLQGSLPAVWGSSLPLLSYVNLSNNALMGGWPDAYGKLHALRILDASSNAMCTLHSLELQQHTRAVFVDTRNQTPVQGACAQAGTNGTAGQQQQGPWGRAQTPFVPQDGVVEKPDGADNLLLMMLAIAVAVAAIGLLGSVLVLATHRVARRRRRLLASTPPTITALPHLLETNVSTATMRASEDVSVVIQDDEDDDDDRGNGVDHDTHPQSHQHQHQHQHQPHHHQYNAHSGNGNGVAEIPKVVLQPDGSSLCLASALQDGGATNEYIAVDDNHVEQHCNQEPVVAEQGGAADVEQGVLATEGAVQGQA